MRIRWYLRGVFWIAVYLVLTLAPLFALLIGPRPPGRGFWPDLSVALGYAGLAMMGFQFLLTARFRRLSAPYGIDIVYHFHRQISLVAFSLILAHPLILFVHNPVNLRLLNIFEPNWAARAGVFSLVALFVLIATSLWRLPLGIQYEPWRMMHGFFGSLAVALAMTHIIFVGYYAHTPWKTWLWVILPLTWIALLMYVRFYRPLRMLQRPYQVTGVIEEVGDAWTLVVEPVGHRGLSFWPGQFAWLTIWRSPFAIQEHPFSIASSAEKPERLCFTIKALGDFTETVKEAQPGDRVYLDGPFGAFTVERFSASAYVFIAGGSGITPIMSMLRTLADQGNRQSLLLIYANVTWDDVIFREELPELEDKLNLRLVHVLEKPPDDWEGERGFVTAEIIERHTEEAWQDPEYFICGPDPMLDAVESALETLHVPMQKYHAERYNLV
jgi:predicted ferric reductase